MTYEDRATIICRHPAHALGGVSAFWPMDTAEQRQAFREKHGRAEFGLDSISGEFGRGVSIMARLKAAREYLPRRLRHFRRLRPKGSPLPTTWHYSAMPGWEYGLRKAA